MRVILAVAAVATWAQAGLGQDLRFDRDRGRQMLDAIKHDIKKEYYDPAFRGIDLEGRFKEADAKIGQAQSLGHIFAIIAQALLDLDDSHTQFFPPTRINRYQYGWEMQAIGEKSYVVAVKPGSDAEAQGLKPGDQLHSVGGFAPDRSNLWKIKYLYYTIRPQPVLSVVAARPGGSPGPIEIAAKVTQLKRVLDLTDTGGMDYWDMIRNAQTEARLHAHLYRELGEDVFIWKMPGFDLSPATLDELMKKARKRKALIVDMRGNGGGRREMLQQLVGLVFDRDVRIADVKGRRGTKPLLGKGSRRDAFGGTIVAILDSESASAAEMFARVLQIEKRGTILGDRSAGAVMQAALKTYSTGVDTQVFYSASITTADVLMADGLSLEDKDVTPDELLLPTAEDLAAGRDPVLARALELAGVKTTPEEAGRLFPVEWEK